MDVLRAVDEGEVAAAFLRAELDSPRFREEVLAGRRGWRMGGLFHGLPAAIDWQRVALAPDEVLDILYIDWDWWLKITGGTRSPREAARRIHGGEIAEVEAEQHRRIAARFQSEDPPPELIAVATPTGPNVLVEGHVRLTSLAVYPQYLPERLEVFLGVGDDVGQWSNY